MKVYGNKQFPLPYAFALLIVSFEVPFVRLQKYGVVINSRIQLIKEIVILKHFSINFQSSLSYAFFMQPLQIMMRVAIIDHAISYVVISIVLTNKMNIHTVLPTNSKLLSSFHNIQIPSIRPIGDISFCWLNFTDFFGIRLHKFLNQQIGSYFANASFRQKTDLINL